MFTSLFIAAFGLLIFAGISSITAIQSFNGIINQWVDRQKHAALHLSNYINNPSKQQLNEFRAAYRKMKRIETFLDSMQQKMVGDGYVGRSTAVGGITRGDQKNLMLANTVLQPFRERREIIGIWNKMRGRTEELNRLAENTRKMVSRGEWTEERRRRSINRLEKLSHWFTDNTLKIDGQLGGLTERVRLLLTWLTTGISVLFVGGVGFIMYSYLNRQRYYYQQLRQTLREKKAMLQEVHHRVKNNLALITGLLEMKADTSHSENVRDEFRDAEERIQSLAMTHEMLYRSECFSNLSFDEYIEKLIGQMQKRYSRVVEEVNLRIDLDPILLNMYQAVPAALLLNELISNAFKHGLRYAADPELRVELGERNRIVTIMIENNGTNMPAHINPATSKSLGMELIRTLCKQLNGDITYSDARHTPVGTRVEVSFPLTDSTSAALTASSD